VTVGAETGVTAAGRAGNGRVIGASALGTLFEWYDFFLYGSLASHIATHFFAGVNEAAGFILALATFAAGFLVRPVGALVFGRIGDRTGRKNTFLITLSLMGVSTFLVGLLPGYDTLGPAAPALLVALRLAQGLAIGGEFGGAVIFVAEHAPTERRGLFTGWIPTTAVAGLLLSLVVITATRAAMAPETFADWGWRVPFLVSVVLLGISLWIRWRLHESPVFLRMQAERRLSNSPLAEAFVEWRNCRLVLIALFGIVMGQAVGYYTATFYAFFFLEKIARVDPAIVTPIFMSALAVSIPVALLAGWLSDRAGRKPVLLAGIGLGALLYFPAFGALLNAANPALAQARRDAPVIVLAAPGDCSLLFEPVLGRSHHSSSCDVVKAFLAHAGISHVTRPLAASGPAQLAIGGRVLAAPSAGLLAGPAPRDAIAQFEAEARAALAAAGYREVADPAHVDAFVIFVILAGLMVLASVPTSVAPTLLVELFPARFRYTAVAVAQNLGNGWFGGLLPAIAFTIVAATGDVFAGLWYPVAIAAVCFVVGLLAVPETRGRAID
jgi:MFS family permease